MWRTDLGGGYVQPETAQKYKPCYFSYTGGSFPKQGMPLHQSKQPPCAEPCSQLSTPLAPVLGGEHSPRQQYTYLAAKSHQENLLKGTIASRQAGVAVAVLCLMDFCQKQEETWPLPCGAGGTCFQNLNSKEE